MLFKSSVDIVLGLPYVIDIAGGTSDDVNDVTAVEGKGSQ